MVLRASGLRSQCARPCSLSPIAVLSERQRNVTKVPVLTCGRDPRPPRRYRCCVGSNDRDRDGQAVGLRDRTGEGHRGRQYRGHCALGGLRRRGRRARVRQRCRGRRGRHRTPGLRVGHAARGIRQGLRVCRLWPDRHQRPHHDPDHRLPQEGRAPPGARLDRRDGEQGRQAADHGRPGGCLDARRGRSLDRVARPCRDSCQPRPPAAPAAVRKLVGTGKINVQDVDAARGAWYAAHEAGNVCTAGTSAAGDANNDGCMDVVDIQAELAAKGQKAAPAEAASITVAAGPQSHLRGHQHGRSAGRRQRRRHLRRQHGPVHAARGHDRGRLGRGRRSHRVRPGGNGAGDHPDHQPAAQHQLAQRHADHRRLHAARQPGQHGDRRLQRHPGRRDPRQRQPRQRARLLHHQRRATPSAAC